MFCPTCACELPSVARFCVKCGSLVGASTAEPENQVLFCVNCGKPYDPSYKFCNYCGYLLPPAEKVRINPAVSVVDDNSSPASVTPNSEFSNESPPVTPLENPPTRSAPYAAFTIQFLASTLLLSCAIFVVVEALAHDRWSQAEIGFLTVAFLGAGTGAIVARRTWARVTAAEPTGNVTVRQHRRMLIKSAVIGVLFFMVSGVVGEAIGHNRAEAAQLGADLLDMRALGDRISKARVAADETVDGYVQMYISIEPDVDHLESVLNHLTGELATYDAKFPQQKQQTSETISGKNTELHRMALLKQQITVARIIENLDPNARIQVWRNQMQPLLDQEIALDKSK